MGKRGNRKGNEGNRTSTTNSASGFHTPLTLREEASGKKQSHNPKSLLKLKHFENVALSSSSSQIPCLGAFFGRRFAEFGESLGISHHPSLFPCQRCETVLQPGFNCTVRIEKNRAKCKRHSNSKTPTQNNVVYTCSFCSYRNLKRGTPTGYVKELTHSKAISLKPKSVNSAAQICVTSVKSNVSDVKTNKADEAPSLAISNASPSLPDSSLASCGAKLLDSKRRKRKKPGPKEEVDDSRPSSAQAERETCSGTSKKKKTWTSLKEIAENEKLERNQRFKNFSIPFVL